jgi:hypothetical protein
MRGAAIDRLGDTEVDEHQPAVCTEQQIRWLDVAVHHPGRVHGTQRGEQLQAQRRGLRWGEPAPTVAQQRGQAGAAVVVHHQPA